MQLLEDQKEAALTKQTELAFSLQKLKSQYLELEQRYKLDVKRLESENNTLRFAVSTQPAEIILPNTAKARQGSSSLLRKNKIAELFKNARELKQRKEEAESLLKDLGSGKLGNKEREREPEQNLSFAQLQKQVKDLKDELESFKKSFKLIQLEKSALEEKIEAFLQTKDPESLVKVLQGQLLACEKELAMKFKDFEEKQASHVTEINKLLEKNCGLKEKIRENEVRFSKKLKELTEERDFIMRNARLSD